jgi:hypothetical protein
VGKTFTVSYRPDFVLTGEDLSGKLDLTCLTLGPLVRDQLKEAYKLSQLSPDKWCVGQEVGQRNIKVFKERVAHLSESLRIFNLFDIAKKKKKKAMSSLEQLERLTIKDGELIPNKKLDKLSELEREIKDKISSKFGIENEKLQNALITLFSQKGVGLQNLIATALSHLIDKLGKGSLVAMGNTDLRHSKTITKGDQVLVSFGCDITLKTTRKERKTTPAGHIDFTVGFTPEGRLFFPEFEIKFGGDLTKEEIQQIQKAYKPYVDVIRSGDGDSMAYIRSLVTAQSSEDIPIDAELTESYSKLADQKEDDFVATTVFPNVRPLVTTTKSGWPRRAFDKVMRYIKAVLNKLKKQENNGLKVTQSYGSSTAFVSGRLPVVPPITSDPVIKAKPAVESEAGSSQPAKAQPLSKMTKLEFSDGKSSTKPVLVSRKYSSLCGSRCLWAVIPPGARERARSGVEEKQPSSISVLAV